MRETPRLQKNAEVGFHLDLPIVPSRVRHHSTVRVCPSCNEPDVFHSSPTVPTVDTSTSRSSSISSNTPLPYADPYLKMTSTMTLGCASMRVAYFFNEEARGLQLKVRGIKCYPGDWWLHCKEQPTKVNMTADGHRNRHGDEECDK